MRNRNRFELLAAGALVAGTPTSALATIDFSASGLGGREASVSFAVTAAGQLQVTLANGGTEPTPNWDATYVLGAVFFNYTGGGTLTANPTALGATASGGVLGSLPTGDTIGSYWAFASGLSGAPHGATEGLSGVGYSISGMPSAANMGPSPEQQVDGIAGGILGWNNTSGGNASVKEPLAYTSITFLMGSGFTTLSPSDFNHVSFQYGTGLSDVNLIPVPEPTTMVAGALLLLPFGMSTLRMLRRSGMA